MDRDFDVKARNEEARKIYQKALKKNETVQRTKKHKDQAGGDRG
jgi:hypothetical protein